MGRGGLYYRASLGGKSHNRTVAPPPPGPVHITPVIGEQLKSIETGNVLEMAPSTGAEIVVQLNEALNRIRTSPWVFAAGALCSVFLISQPAPTQIIGFVAAAATVVLTIVAARWDQGRLAVVVMYDLADETVNNLTRFAQEFEKVGAARRIWNIDTAGNTYDWKRNAGAGRLITRRPATFCQNAPSVLKTNVSVPCLKGGRQSLYFLPDIVLVMQGSHVGALTYEQFEIGWNTTVFIEEDGVPSDSETVGYTWRFVNRDGGPDKRFNNNRRIPKVRYQQMGLRGDGGFQKVLHISKVTDRSEFDAALSALRKMVRQLREVALLPSPQVYPTPEPALSTDGSGDVVPRKNILSPIAYWTAGGLVAILLALIALDRPATVENGAPEPVADVAPQHPAIPTSQRVIHPSFDCKRVYSLVLKLVCSTPVLAASDQELAAAYASAMEKVSSKRALALSERNWIKARNRSGANVAALLQIYHERIGYLRSLQPAPSSANEDTLTLTPRQPSEPLSALDTNQQPAAEPMPPSQIPDNASSRTSPVNQQTQNNNSSSQDKEWYYCGSSHRFYPYVRQCAIPWRRVEPYTPIPLQEEPRSTVSQSGLPPPPNLQPNSASVAERRAGAPRN
jgi:uncharacterized protein